jgi:hypothetical protein
MNSNTLIEVQARRDRVERQNRILIEFLWAMIGVTSIAATSRSGSVIDATEVRTSHFVLVDNRGQPSVETQGIDGVNIQSYLPHKVVQR